MNEINIKIYEDAISEMLKGIEPAIKAGNMNTVEQLLCNIDTCYMHIRMIREDGKGVCND